MASKVKNISFLKVLMGSLPTCTLMKLVTSQKLCGLGPFPDGNPRSTFPLEIGKNQSHEMRGWREQGEHRDDRERHWQGWREEGKFQ